MALAGHPEDLLTRAELGILATGGSIAQAVSAERPERGAEPLGDFGFGWSWSRLMIEFLIDLKEMKLTFHETFKKKKKECRA